MKTQWHGHTVKSFSAVNRLQLQCIDMDETQTMLGLKKRKLQKNNEIQCFRVSSSSMGKIKLYILNDMYMGGENLKEIKEKNLIGLPRD